MPSVLRIGAHTLPNQLFVAPMAGVTDRPFRKLCRRLGAGHAVSEMVTSKRELWNSLKTSRRADHAGEPGPIAVQIAGVEAVVAACAPLSVPVTLKMRTGWCAAVKNAPVLARAAQDAGIAMLTVHGRTREQGYGGTAEHDTVAAIKAVLHIPVVANGDIDSPERAAEVLRATGCDAVMIGRAAQGRPWIFGDIAHFLAHGTHRAPPRLSAVRGWLLEHLEDHLELYGEATGVRSARKHIGWAVRGLPGGEALRQRINLLDEGQAQQRALCDYFDELALHHERLPLPSARCAANDTEPEALAA